MSKLHKYKTIVSPLYVARTAFKVTHHATVVRMQGVVLDHGGVQAIIQNVKAQISNIRKDKEWDKVISKAEEFMKNMMFLIQLLQGSKEEKDVLMSWV